MDTISEVRAQLIAAFDAANPGLFGDRSFSACVRRLPMLAEPDAVADWLYAISGGDGTGGLLLDVRRRIQRGAPPSELRAWQVAQGLLIGLREALREMPAKASCAGCAGGGGVCSACDGTGVDFESDEEAA